MGAMNVGQPLVPAVLAALADAEHSLLQVVAERALSFLSRSCCQLCRLK